ncbi:ankyrin repeat-containing domain protein [Aspergillus pseudoustus]|uniref:Ankyrin repeat-containing domain protein n=1 Tax=Aspergillus pseudoustus TaxID=1810923 RepID=A0ABR4L168_9EURO
MVLLLDHFSRKELLSYWEEHQWAAACYPHMAAATGRTVILQMLQRYGLDIDQMDWRERTPLAVAVRQNQAQVADYLLSVGVGRDLTLLLPAEIIDAENYGEHYRLSMIEWAASRGTLEMMEVLIKHGLFPYRSSQRHGPEPLHWVLQRHDLPYVEDLARLTLEHTTLENIQLHGARLLASAIEHHASTDLIRRLITIGISINEPSWVIPLDLAAQMAEEETIHLLIENGARCTLDAVNAALERNRGDLVDILLPCCGKSTLREHALDGNVEMVKTYLRYGAEVNPTANGKSLLSEVAYRGYLDICKLLVEAGADLTEEDGVGDTPLSNAIFAHRIDVVQFLLERGAPVKSTHYDPMLAVIAAHDLMSSGWNKSVIGFDATKTLIRLLINHGADVNAVSDAYGTPLHKAVRLGVLEIAKCLLDNGAAVDIPVEGYGTPLQLAALLGLQGIMRLLLQHGAKVNGTTGNHGRPLQAAIASGSLVCVKLLLDNGASLESGHGYPNALEKARRCWEDNQNWKRREIIEVIHDCFEERGFFDIPDPS